ncbi:MAG: hypothetical protein CMC40_02775 [Flavobacteriaceae bacterium]|nr:hypothetical protein [Flavobacteriaceae bacterium]|tara:strand:- start:376 stop:870 length:495 start_codon:yes stop_codon:yes gene_type:complete
MIQSTKLFLLGIFCLTISCSNSTKKNNNIQNPSVVSSESPIMTFDKNVHDFGTINEGETVSTLFKFTNTGKSDLIVVDARGSCGCTVPEYPKNVPIPPGGSGELLVSFNSSGNPNMQQKTVTISANTDSGRETVRIMAMVTPDPVRQKARDAQQAARLQQQSNN